MPRKKQETTPEATTETDPLLISRFNPKDVDRNALHAKALLNDELLLAVFDAVANYYRASWENAPRGELERQQIAHLSLAALKDVQAEIRRHISTATLLEAAIKARRDAEALKSRY